MSGQPTRYRAVAYRPDSGKAAYWNGRWSSYERACRQAKRWDDLDVVAIQIWSSETTPNAS